MHHEKKLKPASDVARSFGVSLRSIERWVRNGSVGFPQPIKINRRNYFDATAVEDWKTMRLRDSAGERPDDPLQNRAFVVERTQGDAVTNRHPLTEGANPTTMKRRRKFNFREQ